MTILRTLPLAVAIVSAGLLSACGGGGSNSSSGPSVSGTAASGTAIAGGTVTLKCAAGTAGVVTTNADGSFSIDISAVTLPCVGRVDYKDGSGAAQKLHTFVSAAGTANITPVTELLVAKLSGAAAANAFDNFDVPTVKAFTPAQIAAAAAAVKTYLQNVLGVDVTNLGDDPIGAKFVAKAGSTDGDKFDKVLDDLKNKLVLAGKKLSDAENDVGSAGGTSGGVGCTGSVAAFFNKAKGSYATAAAIFLDPADHSGTAAGFINGTTYTVTVNAACTIAVGTHHFTYVDASYSETPDGGGTQFDVDMASTGLKFAHFEMFTNNKRALGFSDPAKVSTIRLDE